jgi:BASS family bile acid:Na+ symporter
MDRGEVAGLSLRSLLRNNSFVLVLALVSGIVVGQGAVYTRSTVTPLLAVIMTLSLVGVSSDIFSGGRRLVRPVGLAILLNYGVLGGVMLLLSFLLVDDPALRAGYVLIAAVPPAVAVIPFTYRLGGNVSFILLGAVACYFAAFLLTPAITVAALGSSLVSPWRLVSALLQLIAAPFLISRLLRRSTRAVEWLDRYRGGLLNWGFFIVVYTIIGLNRAAFLNLSPELAPMALVSFSCTFLIALAVYGASRALGVAAAGRASYAVMAAWKNYAMAGAIALLYFGEMAALPAAITTAFSIANFVVLNVTIAVR